MGSDRIAIVIALGLAGCYGDVTMGEGPPPFVDPLLGCSLGCHGTDTSNAPPKSISGVMDTTSVAVGAHQAHVIAAPTWHRRVECADCHVVPQEVNAPGHLDGDNRAEVTFSMVAGPGAAWNGTTCTTGCHGSTAIGAAQPTPTWTRVDGTQSTCGSCHGVPPPAPHPSDAKCASCHPTMEEGSTTFRDPESHINGIVEVVGAGATGGCTSCHGSEASSAPPRDLAGNTAATARGVGAHQAHLRTSSWHRVVACSSCHRVPLTADAPGHLDGDNTAEVVFDALNPAGTFANGTCSNLYCHGNGRGNTGTDAWATPGALACGACHSLDGTGMSGDHRKHIREENVRCSECHADVIDANRNIVNAALHVNGVHEVKMANGTWNAATRRCSNLACHEAETW